MNIYGCTVKYDKTQEDGLAKSVCEQYLVKAMTISEATYLLFKELQPQMSGEFNVESVRKINVAEVIESVDSLSDKWYMSKLAFIFFDEKTGQDKMTTIRMLVQSADFDGAVTAVKKNMETTMADWVLVSVSETKYMDYVKYSDREV